MGKERLARAMIEPLVNKAIRDIKTDPERGLRNIIDLALNFPSGRFSKNLFQITQKMLSNENSAYYNLANKIAAEVDIENLKEFSMNIGYNSCTAGAKKLRAKESELVFPIPWSIAIYSSRADRWIEYVDGIISQGIEIGIYTYPIFGGMSFSEDMLDIYKKYSDCAFVLIVNSSEITDERITRLKGINNILISITGKNEQELKNAADILRINERFFAIHMYYGASNIDVLLKNETLKFYEEYTNSFVFYIPEIDCCNEACDEMKVKVRKIRDDQHYAFVLMDLRADLLQIDSIISGGAYSFGFRSDGTIVTANGIVDEVKIDIRENSLVDILIMLNKAGK